MYKKGIIFDLDGTLWDVTNTTYESVNEICKKHNLDEVTINTVCSVFGKNKTESARAYFPKLDIVEAEKMLDEVSAANINRINNFGAKIFTNLVETLNSLKEEYDLFIVSNTSHNEYIEAFLNTSNTFNLFKSYIAASNLHLTKSEAIKKIIDDNKLDNYVYVGDTQIDLDACIPINVPFIHANYGFGHNLDTEFIIDDIKELPTKIKEVETKYFN